MANISQVKLPSGVTYPLKAPVIPYGTVDSTSTSTAFTATVNGITELTDGTIMMLHNGVVTSAAGFTININGLGAKEVYNNLTNATQDTTIFNIAYTMIFVYSTALNDGDGGWWCYRGYDSNTNTIGYQLRTNSGNLVASDDGARYRLWFTSADGQKWVPANTSTSTNATTARSFNTRAIDPFGPIVYNSTNGSVNSGDRPPVGTLWQQYTLTIGYSYVKSLTAWKPVFLKCTPGTDGSAKMKDIVQALPSSDDGYIYIFLGIAYSATAMELRAEHPVYYHDGSRLRLWTGRDIPTKTSDLTNDSGFLTSYTETDPTVPSWAKASSKPTYTASEVGALPSTTTYVSTVNGNSGAVTISVPTKTSDLTNDGDGNSPFATMDDIGQLGGGTITAVKTTAGAHTTINVTSGNAEFNVPTKTSHLTNDSGFITGYTETDPIFSASAASGITSTDITNWNNKVSDDKTWNNVTLTKQQYTDSSNKYIPATTSTSGTTAKYIYATSYAVNIEEGAIPLYDSNGYLYTKGIDSNASSNAVANKSYVDGKISSNIITGVHYNASSKKIYVNTLGGSNSDVVTTATLKTDMALGAAADKAVDTSISDSSTSVNLPTSSAVASFVEGKIPSITLNGSSTTSPSFYAPTTAGTSGYVLKSNGSGAPTWTSAELTDTKVTVAAAADGTTYYPILATGTGTATRQIDPSGALEYMTSEVANAAVLSIGGTYDGYLQFKTSLGGEAIINYSGNANVNDYYLPDASGTIALMSDIPTIDSAMSSSSTNPVQNKVIKSYVDSAIPQTETPSISVTASTGTLVQTLICRYGNVVQLLLRVKNTASVGNNGSVFVGTIATTALRPSFQTRAVAYYGTQIMYGWIEPTGAITIRNESSSAIQNKEFNIDFVYVVS